MRLMYVSTSGEAAAAKVSAKRTSLLAGVSGSGAPALVVNAPADWSEGSIPPPVIRAESGAALTQWASARPDTANATLVWGCVSIPIPGWLDEMRPTVEARVRALAFTTAERISGVSLDTTEGVFDTLKFHERTAGAPVAAVGRTWVGWSEQSLSTCFSVCQAVPSSSDASTCEAVIGEAKLDGSHPPPPPGHLLGTLAWAIHHPSHARAGAGAAVFIAALAAIWSRRRPRSSLFVNTKRFPR